MIAPFLGPNESPVVEIVNGDGRGTAVLLCDHASARVPQRLGTLGLDPARLAEHIGWDPGAAEVARRLSSELDAPLVLSGYSRLVIDCNRPPRSPQSIPECSAGVTIPGNLGLSQAQRDARVEDLFRPYHDTIDRLLERRKREPTLLLSIHSFTPVLGDAPRPWHIGISHWRDRRLTDLLLPELKRNAGLIIGDNEPYPIEVETDYTIPRHGGGRALPSVMIEIRQDGVRTPKDAVDWAARLARAVRAIEQASLRLCESPA